MTLLQVTVLDLQNMFSCVSALLSKAWLGAAPAHAILQTSVNRELNVPYITLPLYM